MNYPGCSILGHDRKDKRSYLSMLWIPYLWQAAATLDREHSNRIPRSVLFAPLSYNEYGFPFFSEKSTAGIFPKLLDPSPQINTKAKSILAYLSTHIFLHFALITKLYHPKTL